MKIPSPLCDPEFRFFLVGNNSKIPMEKSWNLLNCYPFFHEKIVNHNGNYGICTGYGGLIVIDFDSKDYYNQVGHKLPPTFTVLSAGKRLPHMYYILKGQMFKKIGVDNYFDLVSKTRITDIKKISEYDKQAEKMKHGDYLKWLAERKTSIIRVCDIQADRSGIVGPGSVINRRYYNVSNDRELATITLEELQGVFDIKSKYRKEYTGSTEGSPEKVQSTINKLVKMGIKRTSQDMFKCPLHDMAGKGNLIVLDTGRIWCFHCLKLWWTGEELEKDYKEYKNGS